MASRNSAACADSSLTTFRYPLDHAPPRGRPLGASAAPIAATLDADSWRSTAFLRLLSRAISRLSVRWPWPGPPVFSGRRPGCARGLCSRRPIAVSRSSSGSPPRLRVKPRQQHRDDRDRGSARGRQRRLWLGCGPGLGLSPFPVRPVGFDPLRRAREAGLDSDRALSLERGQRVAISRRACPRESRYAPDKRPVVIPCGGEGGIRVEARVAAEIRP